MSPPVALTIAGSDSSGGAGIQADLKTFAAHGVFGASALAALTAQNTQGVKAVHVAPPDFVVAQVRAVLDDLPVAAVKTGMLANAEVVRAVADLAEAGALVNLVVDPVMVSATGHRLLDEAAVGSYRRLIRHARVVTPNLREAQVLVGRELADLDDVRAAAAELRGWGPEAAVVKGGHATRDAGSAAVDVWADGDGVHELAGPRVETTNDHGTGCSFASAVAARLALGDGIADALGAAKGYVARCLVGASGWRLGGGPGPLDHFGWGTDALPRRAERR